MYAEIKVFEDDGTPLMRSPYIMPPTNILTRPEPVNNEIVMTYEFRFGFARVEPIQGEQKNEKL